MAETVRVAVERQQLEALWDAELGRIGKGVVIAKLGGIPADPGATFPLHLPDGKGDPKRRYVEDWLGRMEGEAKATEAKRFRYILIASVVAAVTGVVAAVAAIHEWIK